MNNDNFKGNQPSPYSETARELRDVHARAAASLSKIQHQIRAIGAPKEKPVFVASVSGHDIWTGRAFETPTPVNSNIDQCLDLVRRSPVRARRPRRNVKGDCVFLEHNSRCVPKD